eukprot:869341-Pyramimonas_sp.AAC.2
MEFYEMDSQRSERRTRTYESGGPASHQGLTRPSARCAMTSWTGAAARRSRGRPTSDGFAGRRRFQWSQGTCPSASRTSRHSFQPNRLRRLAFCMRLHQRADDGGY